MICYATRRHIFDKGLREVCQHEVAVRHTLLCFQKNEFYFLKGNARFPLKFSKIELYKLSIISFQLAQSGNGIFMSHFLWTYF